MGNEIVWLVALGRLSAQLAKAATSAERERLLELFVGSARFVADTIRRVRTTLQTPLARNAWNGI